MLIELDNLNAAKEHWNKIRSQPWFKDQASGAFIKRQPLAYELIPILKQRIKELEDKLGSLEPKKGNSMNEHTLNTDQVVSNDPELVKSDLDVVQERTDVTEGLVSEDTGEVRFSQTEEELGKEDETTLVL